MPFTITAASSVQNSIINVVFSEAVLALSELGPTDSLNPSLWTLVDDLGASIQIADIQSNAPGGEGALVGTTQGAQAISITTVGPLSSARTYTLTANAAIQNAPKTLSLSGQLIWTFPGLYAPTALTIEKSQIGVDLLYDIVKADIAADASGDWASQSGPDQVKKKILRRLTTRKGGFYHAPNFGIDLPVKKILTRSRILRAQKDIRREIVKEPGIVNAQATITIDSSGNAFVTVKARTIGDTIVTVGPLGILEA